ncbi:MAG: class II aldolase/adducin family protein, partial [Spirochaetales bacterium]|nr:class II aldolase/adducin family protein [Spirochaetales bacterium]
MGVQELAEVTNRYGSDKDFVLAGGGNTSFKENGIMYVKPSGTTMATISAEDFVKVDLEKLKCMMDKTYSEDSEEREAEALKDMMASRVPGEDKRPSVETLLHFLLPYNYVVHTHPTLINGLTCSKDGESICSEIFGKKALWIPVVNPGYILALTIKERLEEHRRNGGADQIIILQNHGIFVQADSLEEIDNI